MHILFLTTAHNSLSQRAYVELIARGHTVAIQLATSERAMHEAVAQHRPDLIVAPMLKRAIPEAIWRRHTCLIVHPGPQGDRGASSLDWAIAEGAGRWGVTVLQAAAAFDAGDIWATRDFPLREASKSALYREELIAAAIPCLLAAVARFARGDFRPAPLDYGRPEAWGRPRPAMQQADRRIDWSAATATVLRKLRAADSSPGVLDRLGDRELFLFGGHEEARLRGAPGTLLGRRDGALCRATGDGAVWITGVKPRRAGPLPGFKLAATRALSPDDLARVPHLPLAPDAAAPGPTYRELWYEERGAVGSLHFAFSNGAMSTGQCRRLRAAVRQARARPTRVLVLLGGPEYWSNGIHLHAIEAAASPADESWRNINAMNDLVLELLTIEDQLVVAALQGNAGAGGVILALAADYVWARPGVVLNPHYRGLGGLHGSEYWTYLLPRRVGAAQATRLTAALLPVGAAAARALGLVDAVFGAAREAFPAQVAARAAELAHAPRQRALLARKSRRRRRDEARQPLAAYRAAELARMRENFYGPDRAYHEARRAFVYKATPPESEGSPQREPATDTRRGRRIA